MAAEGGGGEGGAVDSLAPAGPDKRRRKTKQPDKEGRERREKSGRRKTDNPRDGDGGRRVKGEKHENGHDHRREKSGRKHEQRPKKPQTEEEQAASAYWTVFEREGNAFLRDALGGANAEDPSGWEFHDVATAFAQQKYQSIQSLYNSICDLYSAGKETDFDIAELLAIPDRVYLVSQLSRGLDKLVDSGELDKYSPPAGQDNGRVRVSKLTAVVAVSGVPVTSPEPEEVVTHPEPLSKPRPKTWNEIRADAECKKKTSSACIIL
eukprot:m.452357 g.452357  ORF g.452357 m.452357 type:complete len:265 (-) comp20311_c0_seq1:1704-2498(-)